MSEKSVEILEVNADPITGAPGAHPAGTAIGAAGAAVAGAGIGAVAGGPVGAVVGATIGAVAGGLAGKSVAEKIDPTVEEAFWRTSFASRPYANHGVGYEQYAPAYKYGWETRGEHAGKPFKEVEKQLEAGWDKVKGTSTLAWNHARSATRDAWHRLETTVSGVGDKAGS